MEIRKFNSMLEVFSAVLSFIWFFLVVAGLILAELSMFLLYIGVCWLAYWRFYDRLRWISKFKYFKKKKHFEKAFLNIYVSNANPARNFTYTPQFRGTRFKIVKRKSKELASKNKVWRSLYKPISKHMEHICMYN